MSDESKLIELVKDGFFDGAEYYEKFYIAKDDKVNLEKLFGLWQSCGGRKYKMKYILSHNETGPAWSGSRLKNPDQEEQLYRECLEAGQTWQEHFNCENIPDDVVL